MKLCLFLQFLWQMAYGDVDVAPCSMPHAKIGITSTIILEFSINHIKLTTMGFFDTTSYFIDEKVNFLQFENEYKVFNDRGEHIGAVKQKLSGGDKVLRLLFNKAMMPFHLQIQNASGMVEATIDRGWTFFMSKITVSGPQGMPLGRVEQKFAFFKPTFKIFDTNNVFLAEITGDRKECNLVINNAQDQQNGQITKKWAGLAQEIFTTADKYNVTLTEYNMSPEHKIAVLASAITIDMVLKESK